MNVKDLAVQLRIGVKTLFEHGITAGIRISKANHRLTQGEVNVLTDVHFGRFKYEKSFKQPVTELLKTAELPEEFKSENNYASQIIELVQHRDIFDSRKPKKLSIGSYEITTIFTDFEAAAICSGLDDHARLLYRRFNSGKCNDIDLVELQKTANSALERFGTKSLSFAINLPPLPFLALNSIPIFDELDKRKGRQYFPIIRINFVNNDGYQERIQISFYAENLNKNRIRNDNVISVKNQTRGISIMKISRDGKVIPDVEAKNILPILHLFIRFAEDTNKMILNYGLETGECSICGRELTNEKSIKRGIGPTCAKG